MEILIDHAAGDANGAREVLTTEMYRRFLVQMDFKGPLRVIDLGANNGGFPLLLKSENIEIEKLVAVELNPQTFSRMRFNIERNLDCGAVLLNVALTGVNREIEINLGAGSTSDSIYGRAAPNSGKTRKIPGLTFDEIYSSAFENETVDLCKMDVEGAEFEVLEGENSRYLDRCRHLLIEIHHERDRRRERVLAKLNDLGFREVNGEAKDDEDHHVHFFVNRQMG
jgi:FkbM family methyltransferase